MVIGWIRGQSQSLVGKSLAPLHILLQLFDLENPDLSFFRRFVHGLACRAFHWLQVQNDREVELAPLQTPEAAVAQALAAADWYGMGPSLAQAKLAKEVEYMYRETLYTKFGEGKLVDEVMLGVLVWEFGM